MKKHYSDVSVLFPSILIHVTQPYLVCSPDAVLTGPDVCSTLVEVKTGKNPPPISSYNDQVQHSLLVSGNSQCIVLFYPTDDHRGHTVQSERIVASIIYASSEWQLHYQAKVQIFFQTYLSWLHQRPVDVESGKLVLHALFAKELPVAPYQRSTNDIHNDSEADGYRLKKHKTAHLRIEAILGTERKGTQELLSAAVQRAF